MNDLISREQAIDALGERPIVWSNDDEYLLGARNQYDMDKLAIETVPSAQPEQRWIPCSERLPEDYKDVLVYFEYYRYGDYDCMFSTYGIGSYSGEYDSWLVNSETGWHKLHVFAWMPLPEPARLDGE